MTFLYAVRYFHVVPVVPPLLSGAFAITVAAAALRLMTDSSAAVDALTPVLLLQLFVASSGFRSAARRGYYDLLLTSATPRWQVAFAHCLVSICPGVVSWICVTALESAVNHGSARVSLAPGTCAAFLGASLIAWSVAVFSSRTATSVVWVLTMTIPAIARAVSPVQLLGVEWRTGHLFTLSAVCLLPALVFGAAVASIVRGTAPLEVTQ